MICKYLPVPPPSVRPSVRQDNSSRSEDDLTYALVQIIRSNNSLKDKINTLDELGKTNASQETIKNLKHSISQYQCLVQYHLTTYMDNTIPGIP